MSNMSRVKPASNFKFAKELGHPSIATSKKGEFPILSQGLVKKGSLKLLCQDRSGLELFDLALKLDPSNADLHFKQGLSLFEYGSIEGHEEELTLASKRMKSATTLAPNHFEAWYTWANTLYLLGDRKKEPSYFSNACKKYKKALALIKSQSPTIQSEFYWDYGNVWMKLAAISEEADDINTAIVAYERAPSLSDTLPAEFWYALAESYSLLAKKNNDTRLFIKSINTYKKGISLHLSSCEGWFRLAQTLHLLYERSHEDDHFSQASECYSTAIQLTSYQRQDIYAQWGLLLLESGQTFQDINTLQHCIEICLKTQREGCLTPQIDRIWAEALAYNGLFTENLELLNAGHSKIETLMESSQTPETLYSYGMVLAALGSYYRDSDYYYQAIERFQEGLSLNRTHHKLWFAIGTSSLAAALIDQDEQSYERALHFFERALNLHVTSIYQYHYANCLAKYSDFLQDQKMLERSLAFFESAINQQPNAFYLHTDWVFQYACTLAEFGNFVENDHYYVKALELLNHILMTKPELPGVHYNLAIVYSQHAELASEPELYYKAIHHYRVASQQDPENDHIILDWALTLLNLAELLDNHDESDHMFRQAEYKMIQAAKCGNIHAYYSLACLYSFTGDLSNSMRFLQKALLYEGLPSSEELLEDDWLDNVRNTDAFQRFIAGLSPPDTH